MGVTVTMVSHKVEVKNTIDSKLKDRMTQACVIVDRQAKQNTTHPMPSGKQHPKRSDTSRLATSVTYEVGIDNGNLTGKVGSNVFYGMFLELGTVRMPPYPWLFPAYELHKDEIVRLIGAKID